MCAWPGSPFPRTHLFGRAAPSQCFPVPGPQHFSLSTAGPTLLWATPLSPVPEAAYRTSGPWATLAPSCCPLTRLLCAPSPGGPSDDLILICSSDPVDLCDAPSCLNIPSAHSQLTEGGVQTGISWAPTRLHKPPFPPAGDIPMVSLTSYRWASTSLYRCTPDPHAADSHLTQLQTLLDATVLIFTRVCAHRLPFSGRQTYPQMDTHTHEPTRHMDTTETPGIHFHAHKHS